MSDTNASPTEREIFVRVSELCPSLQIQDCAAEHRGSRTMVRLPGNRLAWVPSTPASAEALRVENRVLGLIGARCTFAVPAVLAEAEDGSTLRSMVPGHVDPQGLAARLKSEPSLIQATASALANVFAQQHTRISVDDVDGWLPRSPQWPMSRADIEQRLPYVIDDVDLRRRIDLLLDAYKDIGTKPANRVLIHSDLGLHNVAFDPETGTINGVFDYGSAAWADRHLDFRYLVFAAVPDALLDATMAEYGTLTGHAVDRRRVLLCNAAAAISHLADRNGHAPNEAVAGRTLAGDLGWTRWSLGRAGF